MGYEEQVRICAVNPQHRDAGRKNPLKVMLVSSPPDDCVWTWYSELTVQDRVLEIFRDHKITGFTTAPVVARWKERDVDWEPGDQNAGLSPDELVSEPLPNLTEIKVHGWGGFAPPESGIRLLNLCPGCGWTHYTSYCDPSRLADPAQWDGSDMFHVWPLPKHIFISSRLAEVLQVEEVSGVQLVPIAELPHRDPSKDTLTPGSLGAWMSESLAKERGEPLGLYVPL